jgi:putative tryptophan/tyrosine transport system substrate-binding protein
MQVVEILRGANPSDMPYLQETRFELVIYLRTAKELGLLIACPACRDCAP